MISAASGFDRLRLEAAAWYLRHTRWQTLRWRIYRAAGAWARRLLTEEAFRTVRSQWGFDIRVQLNDWLGRQVFVTGEYEPATSRVIATLLNPGDWMIDVGANIGYFTLLGANSVGPRGRITALEAVHKTFHRLCDNVHLNNMQHVHALHNAAAEQPGQVDIYCGPADHLGVSSMICPDTHARAERVDSIPLDDLWDGTRNPTLVKIDVEGAEFDVLRGMQQIITRTHPDLVMEITDALLKQRGGSATSMCDWLRNRGYRMYRIDYHALVQVDEQLSNCPDQFNALFTIRPDLPQSLNVSSFNRSGR